MVTREDKLSESWEMSFLITVHTSLKQIKLVLYLASEYTVKDSVLKIDLYHCDKIQSISFINI